MKKVETQIIEKTSLPTLFIIFNRPDIALRSFSSIRDFKPKQLFIACDGPRPDKDGELELVNKTRNAITNAIDWDCEVNTLFQEKNLGCGNGVYTAINWFFSNVEYGVILEDDCIADSTFFQYAYEMLIRFKEDSRIGMIAGTNPIDLHNYPYSIIYSKYKSCWGWGTWRRAWENMDINLNWRDSIQHKDIITNSGYMGKDFTIWKYKLKCIDNDYVSAWDWQWYFSLAAQNQLCIYPRNNLISNIGNDEQATHTSFSSITIESESLSFPLKFPEYIVPNFKFDRRFYLLSQTLFSRISRLLPYRIKKILKNLIK